MTVPSSAPWHSYVESDVEDVSVDDLVILALDPERAEVAGLRPGAGLEELVPVDDLGPDEAALEVGVDDARALGCLPPGTERRRPRLLLARGEEGTQAEHAVRGVQERG